MNKRLCLLILSYDKNLHLVEINTLLIKKYWSEIPYDQYYISNFKEISNRDLDIKSIKVGKDFSWSISLKTALSKLQLKYDYVLTTFDDLFITSKVDQKNIEKLYEEFIELGGDCIKLINKPRPKKHINNLFGSIETNQPYRTTLVFTIWKISSLLSIIKENESAWEFEKKGGGRANHLTRIYSVLDSEISFYNAVVKGKYQRGFKRILSDLGNNKVSIPTIEYFDVFDMISRLFRKVRHRVYMILKYYIP